MKGVTVMTRHERRARRQGRFVTDKEARLAARLARLDYKVSGETGALRIPARARVPSRSKGRAGPAYVVGVGDLRLARPIIHHRWRRLIASK